MESRYTINKYTFSDGSTVELEDRITPLNEIETDTSYLSCMVDVRRNDDGSFSGNTCFVRVEFSNPKAWGLYRELMNDMMSDVMSAETLCAFVEVVHVIPEKSFTIKHVTGELALIPMNSCAQSGNLTVH
jgi:hypothetical protein